MRCSTFRFGSLLLVLLACGEAAAQSQRPYRLGAVDLKQRVIWGAECREPEGKGLAFGGQDQDAEDGRPHTRVLDERGNWKAIRLELRRNNPLQPLHARVWKARGETKNLLARARYIYFQGPADDEEAQQLRETVEPRRSQLADTLKQILDSLRDMKAGEYERGQLDFARAHVEKASEVLEPIGDSIAPDELKAMHAAQIQLEIAAEALDAEPPPRALDCGPPRKEEAASPPLQRITYDKQTGLYVLFGGDHLDYLTNDTWVFDPAGPKWRQRHPAGAPPPRANHTFEAAGDGRVRMTGGYTYASNTDYVGGQYLDLDDGEWTYDVAGNKWSGGKLAAADSRTYRSGPFHPDFYYQGERPDAAKFEAHLTKLPANEWVETNPPQRPRLNRDWGCARLDPDRDLMLRWSGGHSAHGGTDVPHFHFATNRWELPFPVEFPLGQLYSNTSYPNGYNFNLRPWMTGHTYQNYAYDPPSKKLVKAGRPRHFYIYDPDAADWTGRGEKPPAMQYNSCFYTLTLTATPHGALCWDRNGRVHLFNHAAGRWDELELTGDKLPGAYVDNSTIAYDSKRDRVLIVNTPGYRVPYEGTIYAVDLKTRAVKQLSPAGKEQAHKFAYVDRCCYDAANDLLLMATYLKDSGAVTLTPAYDCAADRWIALDLKYSTGTRLGQVTRAFPHGRSCGLMYDPKRRLIWGTDTNSQVYVLRLDLAAADPKPLE